MNLLKETESSVLLQINNAICVLNQLLLNRGIGTKRHQKCILFYTFFHCVQYKLNQMETILGF